MADKGITINIDFSRSPRQFDAWKLLSDQQTTEIGFGGGAGGGKSILGCYWLMAMALGYPGTGYVLGRKELVNLKRTTLITLLNVFKEQGLKPDVHYQINHQTNVIRFTNGSEIFMFDLSAQPSDPLYTRLGSLEVTGAFVDESNEVPEQAISILTTRIGRRLNDKYNLTPKLLETFNPDKGHVYQRYYKPYISNTLPAHRRFVRALWSDNPYLPERYVEQLRNVRDEKTKQRLLYGNFEYDDDPSTLIEYDAILDLFTNVAAKGDSYLTCDVARYGADKTVIVRWNGWQVEWIKTYEKQGIDKTIEVLRELSATENVPFSRILCDEDGVGGGVVDGLRGIKGFVANSSSLPGRNDTKENYRNLKAQCTYRLADAVNARQIGIHCDNDVKGSIIEELEQLKAKSVDATAPLDLVPKDIIKEVLGRSPDYADALMMRMYFDVKPLQNVFKPTTNFPNYQLNVRQPREATLK